MQKKKEERQGTDAMGWVNPANGRLWKNIGTQKLTEEKQAVADLFLNYDGIAWKR